MRYSKHKSDWSIGALEWKCAGCNRDIQARLEPLVDRETKILCHVCTRRLDDLDRKHLADLLSQGLYEYAPLPAFEGEEQD